MTAKRKGMTFMDTPVASAGAAPDGAKTQAAPAPGSAALSPAEKRKALTPRGPYIADLSDEEIELLWGSLDEGQRRAYLGE